MDGGRTSHKNQSNFIWHDYESSDTRVNYGQILQAGMVLTDDRFKIIEKPIQLRCRLKSTVIPSIGGLIVN